MWVWGWLGELKAAQAAIIAAGVGFFTLACGHLLNAHLNRRRDKFLLEMDSLNLLRAVMIEISHIVRLVRLQSEEFSGHHHALKTFSAINPVTFAVVYPNNLSSLHKLPPVSLSQIVPFYIGLQEHEYNMTTAGVFKVGDSSSLRSFTFQSHQALTVIAGNANIEKNGQLALAACYPIVQALEKKLEGKASGKRGE
ncbi:hypothetical protein [Agrobacterium radiobacter]|uniref:hypothetical protein n=1 Tax=Agrobacterium radiobacter TaxID=362 RepID=UPI003CF983B7